jgi:hypothetical protein
MFQLPIRGIFVLILLGAYALAASIEDLASAVKTRATERRIHGSRGSSKVARSRRPTLKASLPDPSIVDVLDFGANGNGVYDNTAAFNAAVAFLADTGGEIQVPSGNYSFLGTVTLTKGISLTGTFESVPSTSHEIPTRGSILMIRGNRGNESGPSFLYLNEDCAVRGFIFYYPDNVVGAAPAPYPWTIQLNGNNNAVEDVELLNVWNGISAVGAARHYIARVQGQPANIGIKVDQTYDIGRIEDVHWNPWWSDEPAYLSWQITQGVGFLIARTDWEYTLNTFVFGMSIGYQFVSSPDGSCNGNFLGIGADCCTNSSVTVDSSDPYGILITNGEFTSFTFGTDNNFDHTQVIVSSTNAGAIRFVNSAFWGPSHQIAKIAGTGSVGFESCMFNTWDSAKTGQAAIQVSGGDVLVRGCDFQSDKIGGQVILASGTGKAIITENLIAGKLNVTNLGAKKAVVVNNADDS